MQHQTNVMKISLNQFERIYLAVKANSKDCLSDLGAVVEIEQSKHGIFATVNGVIVYAQYPNDKYLSAPLKTNSDLSAERTAYQNKGVKKIGIKNNLIK